MTTLTTWSITFFSKSRIEVFISQSTPYMTSTVLAISAPLTELIVVLPNDHFDHLVYNFVFEEPHRVISQSTPYMTSTVLAISAPLTG
jgi:hypothetical protein